VRSSSSDVAAAGRDLADRTKGSLTKIVCDEEENLPQALASVQRLFDEIIIVDSGSKHRAVGIAQSFGAKVFEFARADSFAAVRNSPDERSVPRSSSRVRCRPTVLSKLSRYA
jgi:hypothetical protein